VSLASGTRLGAYEILALIGSGGMGEVYRARDTKLGREVAIKVLPESFNHDPDRLARFEREAHLLAALNHPHIAHIHGFEDSTGTPALVMELVEGPTLADRIARGPIPLDEALPLAKEIAEALEAAHELGIIHRDLKPANIKVRADGTVKVLDFGLAKAFDPATSSSAGATMSPTLSVHATQAGFILGTAAYMAPEQARGKSVDRRADIWAFGCVLFEMLTGRRAFEGDDISITLASVLKSDPDWRALPNGTPRTLRRLLLRCLNKDPKYRLQAIGDVRIEIDELLSGVSEGAPMTPSTLRWWQWAIVAALVLAAFVGFNWWRGTTPVDRAFMRFSAELLRDDGGTLHLDDAIFGASQPGGWLALSPDARRLAIKAVRDVDGQSRLATRRLDETQFATLAGTENATSPFFSPDGQWIAFFGDGKLRKIPVQGGAPIVLCSAGNFATGSWGDDGSIVGSMNGGVLSRISAEGGTPALVTQLREGELRHSWPQVLPGSKAILFTAYTGGGPEDASIDSLSLKTLERKTLVRGGALGRYVTASDGHAYLVYVHQNTLLAVPFDARKVAVAGTELDPISWTSFERWIRCPACPKRVGAGGPAGSSVTSFELVPSGWSWTMERRSRPSRAISISHRPPSRIGSAMRRQIEPAVAQV
jgi:serine/threonine-protein kinase